MTTKTEVKTEAIGMTVHDATTRTIKGLTCMRNAGYTHITAGAVYVYVSNISDKTKLKVCELPFELSSLSEEAEKLMKTGKACSKEFDVKRVLNDFRDA